MDKQLEALLEAIKRFEEHYQVSPQEQYAQKAQQCAKIKQIIVQYLAKTGANNAVADRLQLQQMAADFLEAVRAAKATYPGLKIT